MTRQIVTLISKADRARAWDRINGAAVGTRLEFSDPRRSVDQNKRLWLILGIISQKLDWHGQKYSPDEWKDFFCHAYRGEKWMPAEDGGMIPIGRSTSKFSKQEFGEFMELIEAFCARHDIHLPWVEA